MFTKKKKKKKNKEKEHTHTKNSVTKNAEVKNALSLTLVCFWFPWFLWPESMCTRCHTHFCCLDIPALYTYTICYLIKTKFITLCGRYHQMHAQLLGQYTPKFTLSGNNAPRYRA